MSEPIEHPNATRLRHYFKAYGAGDLATASSLLAENVVYHAGGQTAVSGTYVGKQEVFRYYEALTGLVTSTTFTIESVLADDAWGVIIAAVGIQRSKSDFSGRSVLIYRIADGQIQEVWELPFDPYAIDAFFR
jgi:ketosteroid isomerase-like protein